MCSQRSNCAPAARELHAVLELFCKGLGVWVPTVVVVHATFIEVFFKIQVSWGPQKELGANPRQFEHWLHDEQTLYQSHEKRDHNTNENIQHKYVNSMLV